MHSSVRNCSLCEPSQLTVNARLESAKEWPELGNSTLLVGDYWEKMTMATNSMFQLATIAKVWNATIPIPFTADSYLYGLPTGKINLDAIYDIERLLHLAKQYDINVFSTFEQFINSASRNVIGIEVKYAKNQSQLHAHVPHHGDRSQLKHAIRCHCHGFPNSCTAPRG